MTRPAFHALYEPLGGATGVFSDRVAAYLQSRPDYPPALFDAVIAATGLAPGMAVADLGAGTGLMTRDWLARGLRVWAVEPNGDMRAAADQWLGAQPGYRSVAGRAEATGLADASVDLVAAAQAFHWFDADAARSECRRILREGGWAALVWNDRREVDPVNEGIDAIAACHGGPARAAMAATSRDEAPIARFFGGRVPAPQRFAHAQALDIDGLAGLLFSRSYMPPADSAAGQAVRRDSDALFARLQCNGLVTVPYETVLYLGRLD
jgi:SAM-dependent methyltransferase